MEMTLSIITSFVLGTLIVFGSCYLIIRLFHKSQSNKYANNTEDVIPLEERYPEIRNMIRIICSNFGDGLYKVSVDGWTEENINRFYKSFRDLLGSYKESKYNISGKDFLIFFLGLPIDFYTHPEVIDKHFESMEKIAAKVLGYKCHVEIYKDTKGILVRSVE